MQFTRFQMNVQRIATIMIIPLMVLGFMACESATQPGSGLPYGSPPFTPSPLPALNLEEANVAAQATLVSGQSLMMDLSRQATAVNMDMEQAANAAVQTTMDYNQRQLMELSIRSTDVSQNVVQAAATQQFIVEQTQIAWNATAIVQGQIAAQQFSIEQTQVAWNAAVAAQNQAATQQFFTEQTQVAWYVTATAQSLVATQQFIAEQNQLAWYATATSQSQAATATNFAYIINVTQTEQAHAILYIQSTQAAQAKATLAAYLLTATPLAALQADIVRTRGAAERLAWWESFIVTPLKFSLFFLVVVLLIVGGVLAYDRIMPLLELRLRTISRANYSPLLLVDGIFVETTPSQPRLLVDDTPQVEIVGPSEPSVINWITEAEERLRSDKGNQT